MKVQCLFLVCFTFLWYYVTSQEVEDTSRRFVFEDDLCRTYGGMRGLCVSIRRCPPLLRLLQQKPLSNAAKKILKGSHCGFLDKLPKVCCRYSSVTPVMSTTPEPPYGPPIVTEPPYRPPIVTELPKPPMGSLLPKPPNNQNLFPNEARCGRSYINRIYGGDNATFGEFPWIARLGFTVPGSPDTVFLCGGALINQRYVITAAHCVTSLRAGYKLVSVRLGEYRTSTNPDCLISAFCAPPVQDHRIEEIVPHSLYDRLKLINDIALIRLKSNVRMNAYVQPICLPFRNEERDFLQPRFTVAGWGKTENSRASDVLQKVRIPWVNHEKCAKAFEGASVVDRNIHICAGGVKGQDSCKGDSGGPLMFDKLNSDNPTTLLIGVVSYGSTACGLENKPAVYTKISWFLNWIKNNVRK